MWNPLTKLREKFGKPKAPGAKHQHIDKELVEAAKDASAPDLKELEKKGLLGKFFRHWKNPAFLSQMRTVAARMKAEGVDIKDQKAVKEWVEKHEAEIESGRLEAPAESEKKTFTKSAPSVSRNAPCPCGSGKKHKKCCGR
ncbi:MAG: SEC-C metal-binding domain-containing protein [Elusimicrobiota bacterium]